MSDFTPPLDEGGARRIAVDSSRSMRAIAREVAALFDGLEGPRQRGALLASELIAQVAGPTPGRDRRSVELTVQRRAGAVHLEATGPAAPAINGAADHDGGPADPNTDWGAFLMDRLADRWGLNGGSRPAIWVEIAIPG